MVKQISVQDVVEQIEKNLNAILGEISFVKARGVRKKAALDPGTRADLVAEVEIAGELKKLVVEVRATGEPRVARMVGFQLLNYMQGFPEAYGIFAAPYISDRGRQICKEMKIGCLDLAGNAYLAFDQVFIDRRGYPNPYPERRALKSLFSPKSSRILRVLLANPERRWHLQNIAAEVDVSLGQTSDVKQALLSQEWIKEEKKAFWLTEPEELLLEWARNYDYRKNRSAWFYSNLSKMETEKAVATECQRQGLRYTLALFSGASRLAPFVQSPRSFIFIEERIEEIAVALGFRPVNTGANLVLLRPYDEGVFYGLQDINELKVTSDVQLYLDLQSYRGRGEEAAQAILEQRIKPRW